MNSDSEQPGTLFVVATPIGNLEDITLRALRILREVDTVLAEDTRRTRVLLSHHGIGTPMQSVHAHSTDARLTAIVAELGRGARVALVTDAGTPVVSDPGLRLISLAADRGIRVVAAPGASAVTTAVAVCALPCDRFRFVGFLPRSGRKRKETLQAIATDRDATVLFEAAPRLSTTLEELEAMLEPDRQLAVCRELTKMYEEVARGSAAELSERFASGTRGEITLVIAGCEPKSRRSEDLPQAEALDARILGWLSKGLSVRDAAQKLAATTGLPKREAYARVLKVARCRD